MAQKLVNLGQRMATATPRFATKLSFQALGKKILILMRVSVYVSFDLLCMINCNWYDIEGIRCLLQYQTPS